MIALASIAFNQPRLIQEQLRLVEKYVEDENWLCVFDASSVELEAAKIQEVCENWMDAHGSCDYRWLSTQSHDEALIAAAAVLLEESDAPYFGFLDHDVFPTRPTTLIDKIEPAGFYGVGQRHAPTGHLYLWPGFCFFSREWLAGRPLDFSGIRGDVPADNGDTGSMLWPLFQDEDWADLYRPDHGYRAIREPDEFGLQSWGVETIGDWLHVSNGSHWMKVPDPDERDRLVFDMLAAL